MKSQRFMKVKRRSVLFARANSKLCFLLQKIIFAAENQLAPDPQSGGAFASKVGKRNRNKKWNGYGK